MQRKLIHIVRHCMHDCTDVLGRHEIRNVRVKQQSSYHNEENKKKWNENKRLCQTTLGFIIE